MKRLKPYLDCVIFCQLTLNHQLEILTSFITPDIKKIVKNRLFNGLKFFDGHTFKSPHSKGDAKLALLLVRIANPEESLSADELQLIKGIQRNGGAL